MLVDEKPPLDEDLLLHYGIPGMKWGQRHDYIPIGRGGGGGGGSAPTPRFGRGPAPSANSGRRSGGGGSAPQQQGMSTMKKLAIGGGIVAGVAAGAYLLSKTGTRPHAASMTSRSNAIGIKTTMGILKRTGKVGISGIKGMPKVAKVGGKATYKTTKFVGKTVGKGGKTVVVNSSRATRDFISRMRNSAGGGPSKVRGEKFGKLLLGQYGTSGFTSGGGLAYVPTRLPRRDQGWHGSE